MSARKIGIRVAADVTVVGEPDEDQRIITWLHCTIYEMTESDCERPAYRIPMGSPNRILPGSANRIQRGSANRIRILVAFVIAHLTRQLDSASAGSANWIPRGSANRIRAARASFVAFATILLATGCASRVPAPPAHRRSGQRRSARGFVFA
jgi:hypothetical protein